LIPGYRIWQTVQLPDNIKEVEGKRNVLFCGKIRKELI
jgi:hypothetical protein